MTYQITSGTVDKPQRVLIYGVEGVGKTTLAAQFPKPLFIDTEGSSGHLDVRRLPAPATWTELLEEVRWVRDYPYECGGTLVVDTLDWAERMCFEHVCKQKGWESIENPKWGKGYTIAYEEFGKLVNLLTECRDAGLNVVAVCHAVKEKVEQPDEMGTYDSWGPKLLNSRKTSIAAMVKEWADAVLFLNFKTVVVATDVGSDGKARKHKAQNGKDRVMYCSHAAAWDAKNRWGLPDEAPLDYAWIAPHVPVPNLGEDGPLPPGITQADVEAARTMPTPFDEPAEIDVGGDNHGTTEKVYQGEPVPPKAPEHLRNLARMIAEAGIGRQEFVTAVARRTGYVTESTPFESLAPDLAAWAETVVPQIKQYIDAGMPADREH